MILHFKVVWALARPSTEQIRYKSVQTRGVSSLFVFCLWRNILFAIFQIYGYIPVDTMFSYNNCRGRTKDSSQSSSMRPDISSGPLDLVGLIARKRDKSSPSVISTTLKRALVKKEKGARHWS